MSTRTQVPALGAEGWFTSDPEPALLGLKCQACGTYVFPKADVGCPNPACDGGHDGTELAEARLSRRGTIWSYTDARYRPPAPYVVPTDEHEPFCIAAVELADEGIVVMGQVVAGVSVDDLTVGQPVELVIDVLFTEDDTDHMIWKWKPLAAAGEAN